MPKTTMLLLAVLTVILLTIGLAARNRCEGCKAVLGLMLISGSLDGRE